MFPTANLSLTVSHFQSLCKKLNSRLVTQMNAAASREPLGSCQEQAGVAHPSLETHEPSCWECSTCVEEEQSCLAAGGSHIQGEILPGI